MNLKGFKAHVVGGLVVGAEPLPAERKYLGESPSLAANQAPPETSTPPSSHSRGGRESTADSVAESERLWGGTRALEWGRAGWVGRRLKPGSAPFLKHVLGQEKPWLLKFIEWD